jgi:ribosome-associated toxin RatA of RatAB toxin-antitoxin module
MPYQFLFSIILLLTGFLNYSESEWKLALEKEGILVFTRHVDGSDFKEFKSEMVMDGTVSEIADVIADVEKYPEWCYKTTSVKIIRKEGNTIRYFYVSDTPKFLKTRVAFFESKKVSVAQTNDVFFYLNDIRGNEPISENCILIPTMKGYWKLTPAGENKVHVMMQMLTEPGGIIPAWLANMVVVDSPYTTLSNLRKRLIDKRSPVK